MVLDSKTDSVMTESKLEIVKYINDPVYGGIPITKIELELTGFDALIGMDIIGLGDFVVSSYEGKTAFSFRMPSLHCFDFVENTYMLPRNSQKGPSRNAPCPCGSGKKYKHCHGKISQK